MCIGIRWPGSDEMENLHTDRPLLYSAGVNASRAGNWSVSGAEGADVLI